MSNGLLRGLAARALGLEAPLRSQRARGLDRLPIRPGLADDASPWEVPTPSWATPDVQSQVTPAQTEVDMDAAKVSTIEPLRDTATGVASDRTEGPTPRLGTSLPHRAVRDRAPAPAPALATPPDPVVRIATDKPAISPRPVALATPAFTAVDAPSMPTTTVSVPEPLLPLAVARPLPRPTAPSVAATLRRGTAPRLGTAEAPTEVHVSIGRVELTAIAPATSGRATARREAPAGRSLADYLRGGGTGDRKPT